MSLWGSQTCQQCGAEVVMGVTVCTGGDDTDLSVGSAGRVVDNSDVVGSGPSGSAPGLMNLLFLVYRAPELVCTW